MKRLIIFLAWLALALLVAIEPEELVEANHGRYKRRKGQ